jgi:magnesium chelatase accessory protein
MGQGPLILLLHGTGASTHSWAELMPRLTQHATVLALDLPGHGFTDMPHASRLSLPGMADAIGAVLAQLDARPVLVVGHSAGAAIAAQLCLDEHIAPQVLVSLNGAFLPLNGWPGQVFSPVAKLLAATPFVPRLFAWRAAKPGVVHRLLEGTGSTLDARATELYGRLIASPGHAAGALGMMANWDLQTLQRALPKLTIPVHLVVAANDRAIPPEQARSVQALLPRSDLEVLSDLGHLAHEERPDVVARIVLQRLAGCGRAVEKNY